MRVPLPLRMKLGIKKTFSRGIRCVDRVLLLLLVVVVAVLFGVVERGILVECVCVCTDGEVCGGGGVIECGGRCCWIDIPLVVSGRGIVSGT